MKMKNGIGRNKYQENFSKMDKEQAREVIKKYYRGYMV